MPIYEYQCKICGHELEVMQKISDPALVQCPNCHEDSLEKLVSAGGFQLKGTGWYVTDFKNKGKTLPKSSDSTDAKSDSKTSSAEKSSSTETKSDSKTGSNSDKT